MKVEEILDYKLKKLLSSDSYGKVSAEDKQFILAQAKSKIQAYCHRTDMPKSIYYIWADMAIEFLKILNSSLFKVDVTSEEELGKRITSVKAGDTTISLDSGSTSDSIDTGYVPTSEDDILNSFSDQLKQFRKVAAGCGDTTHGL